MKKVNYHKTPAMVKVHGSMSPSEAVERVRSTNLSALDRLPNDARKTRVKVMTDSTDGFFKRVLENARKTGPW